MVLISGRCVAEVALDKLYLMTPDYVDALSQHLNSLVGKLDSIPVVILMVFRALRK